MVSSSFKSPRVMVAEPLACGRQLLMASDDATRLNVKPECWAFRSAVGLLEAFALVPQAASASTSRARRGDPLSQRFNSFNMVFGFLSFLCTSLEVAQFV